MSWRMHWRDLKKPQHKPNLYIYFYMIEYELLLKTFSRKLTVIFLSSILED